MQRGIYFHCVASGLFCFTMAFSLVHAQAPNVAFRVDTDVYEETQKEPVKQTLTLFQNGVYYDFAMEKSQSVTMIDPQHERIVLIHPERRVKTTFNMPQLLTYVEDIKQQISGKQHELAKMLAAVEQVRFDPAENKIRVGDDTFYYEATMQSPKSPEMAAQYADFANWSARLNAVLPPKFPPYLRLELNRQLAERGMLPDAIYRIAKHNNHTVTIRSQLIANGRLSTEDISKLTAVGELLQTCQEVSKDDFFNPQAALIGKSATPGSRSQSR
jgi:hypothetical protein